MRWTLQSCWSVHFQVGSQIQNSAVVPSSWLATQLEAVCCPAFAKRGWTRTVRDYRRGKSKGQTAGQERRRGWPRFYFRRGCLIDALVNADAVQAVSPGFMENNQLCFNAYWRGGEVLIVELILPSTSYLNDSLGALKIVQSLKLCPALCDSMDYSMSDFPCLSLSPGVSATHVHWVSDAV